MKCETGAVRGSEIDHNIRRTMRHVAALDRTDDRIRRPPPSFRPFFSVLHHPSSCHTSTSQLHRKTEIHSGDSSGARHILTKSPVRRDVQTPAI